MPGPLSNSHAVTKLRAQDLERARAFYRDKRPSPTCEPGV